MVGGRGEATGRHRALKEADMDLDSAVAGPSAASLKWGVGPGELAMWVADMDFPVDDGVRRAVAAVAAEGRFGYATSDVRPLAEALSGWY
ncbi:MAG: hypothetical protein LBD90_03215 [Bifidobacteriaceae bacterium]|nr:hypothetical protein [Bifidobacteriaceae bacterium]